MSQHELNPNNGREVAYYRRERPLRILTWHIHGSYLYYLLQVPHEFYIPVKPGRPAAYGGLPVGSSFKWPANAHEIPAEEVRNLDLDVILFQSRGNWDIDQYELLTEDQLALPKVYLEHDPPREVPTDTRHLVDDPHTLLVHVTAFNDLMWDSGRTPTKVIDHGVMVPEDVRYTGELERGIVVVNGLKQRGRRLGADIFERVREQIPLDLVGMFSTEMGGLGEVTHDQLPAFEARYRFFFNPIRYTSLGLAVIEAMMVGMPVIGLATTEMTTAVENGISGYVDTNIDHLIGCMQELLANPAEALRLGQGARRRAMERFSIQRFIRDWEEALALVSGREAWNFKTPKTHVVTVE